MKWFVLENEEIKGPYSKKEVQKSFQGRDVLVWGPGLDEWILHSELSQAKPKKSFHEENMMSSFNSPTEKTTIDQPFSESTVIEANLGFPSEETNQGFNEKTRVDQPLNESTVVDLKVAPPEDSIDWYYAYEGKRSNALNWEDLISTVSLLSNIEKVHVWNKSLENWKKIEDIPELYEQVLYYSYKNAA